MAERFSGSEKKGNVQRIRETARVFGWALAAGMIVGGVVLDNRTLVNAGIVTALIDATADVAFEMIVSVGKDVKRDLFGSPQKA
jgi:hypothetical protein